MLPASAPEPLAVLKLDTEAVRIRIVSEPHLVYNVFGYQPAIDVMHLKRHRRTRRFLSARSLGVKLNEIRVSNQIPGLSGIEVWVHKASNSRSARYVVSE